MQELELTKTLPFGLCITTGSSDNLYEANKEARRIRNEVNRLDKHGHDWNNIRKPVENRANHVKNTTQLIIEKSLEEINRYHDNKTDTNWNRPKTYKQELYPVPMNYGEGYNLTIDQQSNNINFRISYKPYNYVKGTLQGSPDHFEQLHTALQDDEWRVGTAELVKKHNTWQLHITVTHKTHTVAVPEDADTIIGVDVNEDCIALAATTPNGEVNDSIVLEYPQIKQQRHEFFTKRKRLQKARKKSIQSKLQTREQDYVHDKLHKTSRKVINWISRFDNPVLVFENLKDMRESIDYGTRMNRRLHSLPFSKLQSFISYKGAWKGIPTVKVDPAYTSQRCPHSDCLHTERANRYKKRFKCVECGFQDHADRKAAICIAQEWVCREEEYENVAPLKKLPVVRTVELREGLSGRGGAIDSHGLDLSSGVHWHEKPTRDESVHQVREELKPVASEAVSD